MLLSKNFFRQKHQKEENNNNYNNNYLNVKTHEHKYNNRFNQLLLSSNLITSKHFFFGCGKNGFGKTVGQIGSGTFREQHDI